MAGTRRRDNNRRERGTGGIGREMHGRTRDALVAKLAEGKAVCGNCGREGSGSVLKLLDKPYPKAAEVACRNGAGCRGRQRRANADRERFASDEDAARAGFESSDG